MTDEAETDEADDGMGDLQLELDRLTLARLRAVVDVMASYLEHGDNVAIGVTAYEATRIADGMQKSVVTRLHGQAARPMTLAGLRETADDLTRQGAGRLEEIMGEIDARFGDRNLTALADLRKAYAARLPADVVAKYRAEGVL